MNGRSIRLTAWAGWILSHTLVSLAQPVRTQSAEEGVPFVRWFSPQEYSGTPQIFSIEEDDRGILYFGQSSGGLKEYDGVSWRTISMPHNAIVRTLARGSDGRIYAGEVGDFGYLQPDKTGEMRFQSLLASVPNEDRGFQDVRRMHSTPDGIYVQSFERLFLLKPEGNGWRTQVWRPQTRFRYSFQVFGTIYVAVSGVGLQKVNKGVLETIAVSGLEKSPESLVMAMLPYAAKGPDGPRILVVTSDRQWKILDDKGLRPFPVTAGPWDQLGATTAAAALADGGFAFGKRGGGVLILERDGRVRRYLDRNAGIAADGVVSLFNDRKGNIWLGLQNGIAMVEEASPFTEFNRARGVSAVVNQIVRHQGRLHVATMIGLKYLDTASGEFRNIAGVDTAQVLGLFAHGDRLLAAAGRDGVFSITGTSAKRAVNLRQGSIYFTMAKSSEDPNRVWLGTSDGLAAMRWNGAQWIDEGLIVKTPEIRTIVEPQPGLLWLGTMSQGAVRVRMAAGKDPEVKRFGKKDGLPADGGIFVSQVAGRILFASPDGVREFDAASERFIASPLFGSIPTGGAAEEYAVAPDEKGNVWINLGVRPVLLFKRPDGSYALDQNRMRRIGDGMVQAMSVDQDGVLWMGGVERIFRYAPTKASTDLKPMPALIRRVTVGDLEKRVIYGGGGEASPVVIPFQDNMVRFECALGSYEDPGRNLYQSKLEGFDGGWSAWTTENRRDYTNLPPGEYTFHVRARNMLARESSEAVFRLEVLPPWYRTWWAFLLYVAAFTSLIVVADRVMRARVIARERQQSLLREAQLRAEKAAAEAKVLQAENERNKNVQLLSEIGKDLTSSLDVDTIFAKLHDHVKPLMDASIFAVGIYHKQREEIEYRFVATNGERKPSFSLPAKNNPSIPAWCLDNRKAAVLNDVGKDCSQYGNSAGNCPGDGASPSKPASLIYLPLMMQDRPIGVISVQSAVPNAYSDYHVDLLENLASYTAIALDNADAYHRLKSAQEQLVVQEKLASLGALTAGIAHEIKNPLNFVNNFADLSVELMEELREEVEKLRNGEAPDVDNMEDLLEDLTGNAKKINEHGKRADGIVKSMLLHSRGQAGERQITDINAMVEEYLNLSYHGMRAQDSTFNATIERHFAADLGKIDAIPQDLSRVFLNILNNACYAVNERLKKQGAGYSPKLVVRTVNLGDEIEVRIRDNGLGIPPEVRDKIFNPFFTTKPTGQGTGLGLSISHDIVVQEHQGQLEVETEAGQFTEFIVRLPRHWREA